MSITVKEIENFREGMKRLYAIDLHRAINALCDAAARGIPVSMEPDGEGLLPCPLCGGPALGVDHPPHKHFFVLMPDHPGSYTIECPKCNIGAIAENKAACVASWNSRATPATREDELAFVPGAWRCAKCKLRLVASILSVSNGAMGPNNEPQKCPNECGPMWRVTEREDRQQAQRDFLGLWEEHHALLDAHPDWVLTKDRRPDSAVPVLMQVYSGDADWMQTGSYNGFGWSDIHGKKLEPGLNVTHWRPLPPSHGAPK